jgi:hypothetical protein
MRASEFIFELTNPSDPPPKSGDPEFEKSREFFEKVIKTAIKDFNDELKFLQKNNVAEYDRKTTDEDKLRNDLTNSVVDYLLSKGAGNFVPKDKSNFISKFTLRASEAEFNDTTGEVIFKNPLPIIALSNQATTSWYANRNARFTNPTLWARYQGPSSGSVGRRVAPIDPAVSRDIETIIKTTVTDESFWKNLLNKISSNDTKNQIYTVLNQVYKTDDYIPEFPTKVAPIDARAANLLARELGLTAVDDTAFWFEFTKKLNSRPEIIIRILKDYY